MSPLKRSDLPLRKLSQGKVRDVYCVDADRLLLVATDRVSAFDVVMGEAVPYKGQVLTQMSAWWCRRLEDVVNHHTISANTDEIVRAVPALAAHREPSTAAPPCAEGRRCFRLNASSAAIFPARRGRNTARAVPWPASRCPNISSIARRWSR